MRTEELNRCHRLNSHSADRTNACSVLGPDLDWVRSISKHSPGKDITGRLHI